MKHLPSIRDVERDMSINLAIVMGCSRLRNVRDINERIGMLNLFFSTRTFVAGCGLR